MSLAVRILDGGLATELERRGHDLSDDLWSARLLRDDPGAIRAAHERFFLAGAQVATTASYQASVQGFAAAGVDRADAERLIRSSVLLAREAAAEVSGGAADGVRRWVAASVGPYGAVRADGSEYSGDYGVTDAFLRDFHGPRLEVLAAAEPDLLAIETIPSEQEVAVLLSLLAELEGLPPAWVSATCRSSTLTRRGEQVTRVFGLASGHPGVVAVGVNCTAPEHVEPLVRAAVVASGKPAVAYPNSGETWDEATGAWRGDGPGVSVQAARRWAAAGAEWIGGCCRVTSADIATLADGLAA